jgi:predicted nucleic acid-binding protein
VRETVLADSGPLYAALDPQDSHHRRAVSDLRHFAHERSEVIIPYPILLEAYSMAMRRLGPVIASQWLSEATEGTLINPSPEDYRQAAAKLNVFPDQAITIFDATVAVLASRLSLRAWTYDHHFDVMRVPVWRR